MVFETNNRKVRRVDLMVAPELANFIETEALPSTGVDSDQFWQGFSKLVRDFSSMNGALLSKRQKLQDQIDNWHLDNRTKPHDSSAYKAFLKDIGYLVAEGENFKIETCNIDPEVAKIPGPQLVVPATNARFALNAANARWGSLYDCLYGTDAMGAPPADSALDEGRVARVVFRTAVFLDEIFPLTGNSHAAAKRYRIVDRKLEVDGNALENPRAFVGYRGATSAPDAVLLCNNGLHVELVFDRSHRIGKKSASGLADVKMESAMSAIIDLEDSVACVDAEDKVLAYRNWLGLMKGNLEESFQKGSKTIVRNLNPDRQYVGPDGSSVNIKGRALLLVRNVGLFMTSPAICDLDGNEIFEGLMDAMITTLIALHDVKKHTDRQNSLTGSVYVVKPKLHGPEEIAFTDSVFAFVESSLGLPEDTVKLGIMDEERRTSVNLKESIRAAGKRVCFINTGFLDRTGDEIHTSMEAGPVSRKDFIKRQSWIDAYENQNVDIGLECGLSGKAQIGKGMWAMPDKMFDMLEQKIGHPRSGANCAWVPNPVAATLHATHYHKVDVRDVQSRIVQNGRRNFVDSLLEIPTALHRNWTREQIIREVENNAQGILGYVVRWVDQGIGCSKVPDINDIGLMEDRATCRISAQHIANWLHHGIVTKDEVTDIMKKMATIVDHQNTADPDYRPMSPGFDGEAFLAALELVLEARNQPSGYTEPILHKWRLKVKHKGKTGLGINQ